MECESLISYFLYLFIAHKYRFLLPKLQLATVLKEPTMHMREEAANNLLQELDEIYKETIQRIQSQSKGMKNLAMKILMWIDVAFRPLRLKELEHALAVESGHTNLVKNNIPSLNTMLKACCGLVIVDTETSSVRFIHYTLQEYLQK